MCEERRRKKQAPAAGTRDSDWKERKAKQRKAKQSKGRRRKERSEGKPEKRRMSGRDAQQKIKQLLDTITPRFEKEVGRGGEEGRGR